VKEGRGLGTAPCLQPQLDVLPGPYNRYYLRDNNKSRRFGDLRLPAAVPLTCTVPRPPRRGRAAEDLAP